MFKPQLNLTRRWVRTRPGSVLILVIALLVLLALIGTAYLSSTQTERYSAVQNDINTEADLLIQGLQVAVNGAIANGVNGSNGSGSQYRPPLREMPTYVGGVATPPLAAIGYQNYDSAVGDPNATPTSAAPSNLFLADRIPTLPLSTNYPTWGSISWPLFTDSSGNYTFDSPFESSVSTYLAINKGKIVSVPTSRVIDGKTYPALYYYVPSPDPVNPTLFYTSPTTSVPVINPGQFLTPNGLGARYAFISASAAGDGIADAGLCQMPIGQINGITYYYATRVIDSNSAVNVSSAWSSTADPLISNVTEPITPPGTPNAPTRNYGFFRSNIGLREMLNSTSEMDALNAYRFNGALPGSGGVPSMAPKPVGDDAVTRADFTWYSAGDAMEQQLARRAGNPGYNSNAIKYAWLGQSASAALAYKFSLVNKNAALSLVEQLLPSETYTYAAARGGDSPYSPSQVVNASSFSAPGYWFGDLFNFSPTSNNMPLRTLLVGTDPISNAIPNWSSSPSTIPQLWSSTTPYEFGDAVTYNKYTYTCLLHNTGQTPGAALASPEYWTLVPWTTQPVKTSINTATFNQLWLGFCQSMTDSITPAAAGAIPLWQPPMLPANQSANYPETQMQMFRSVIRDNRSLPVANTTNTGVPQTSPTSTSRVQMTPMQMMQLRAALAAINTQAMRNSPSDLTTNQIRSHHITLAADNPGAAPSAAAYDVEVFSSGVQPYIAQMYAVVQDIGGAASKNFIAFQLINPYPVAINVTANWGFATIDRTVVKAAPSLTLTTIFSAPTDLTPFTIPAATATGPGSIMIYDGALPPSLPATPSAVKLVGLIKAIGKELVILKPRLLNGNTSSQNSAADTYNEATAVVGIPNLYDLVPVDQIDMTGTDAVTFPAYLVYKRAANPTLAGPNGGTYAWNFVWPGFYTPYNNYNTIGPKIPPQNTPAAQPIATYPFSQPILNLTAEPAPGSLDFNSLTGGAEDITAVSAPAPTYNTITLQVNNVGFPGTNPILTAANTFPFGGFARNADLLQVPFIGAYRICAAGTSASVGFYEMNSVTMDSSLANDSTLQPSTSNTTLTALKVLPSSSGYSTVNPVATVTADSITDPFVEQIGRFCPVGDSNGTGATNLLDFGQDPTNWHYHWAKHLFDYFTVQAPHDDYFPNVDPAIADATATPPIPEKFPGASLTPSTVVPINNSQSVPPGGLGYYANASVAGKSEDTVGVEGLININTAPWPVLARLPFVAAGTDKITFDDTTGKTTPALLTAPTAPTAAPNGIDDNTDIAKAIVEYRRLNGPFKSIEDLYKVPAFRLETEFLLVADPTNAIGLGDFSGGPTSTLATPTPDGIRFDFEERFLLLNNISNLITTRSDTFTCYVLLQGWRNVGTGHPTLAVERRASFLVDRNTVTPANNQPISFKIPN